jgi:ankyrin repeat protein
VPTFPLPERPDLGQLRNLARELQRKVRAGDPAALALADQATAVRGYALSAAQLVLARRYGFASWPRLRRHVEVITARSWTLSEPASARPDFLRLACLTFGDDSADRRAGAAALLAADPALPATSLAVAAACADVDQVRRHLAADPAAAARRADPFDWSPLMYQAYARHDPGIGRDATVATARLLIEAGADPNDGRFFLGLPTPFTVLTGVFGGASAELPAHPHATALAELLLAAGAEPNDGQTLYNRMFATDDDHLRVLFAHGLGRGDGGPWHRLLGDQLESPRVMLAALLDWAVAHDQRARVALLAANGVDVTSPITASRHYSAIGRTPIEIALLSGNTELADQLRAAGAAEPRLSPEETFVAAALTGDARAVAAAPAPVVTAARRLRPGLIVWATALGRTATVELLVSSGFDINAYGRADVPVEDRWETALHTAVRNNDLPLARRLLELGADPDLRDKRFASTPLGWAQHLGHPALVDLLTPR